MAARLVPWKPDCVEKALVAKKMLAREGLDHRLSQGVRRTHNGVEAHVWMISGEVTVTGGDRDSHALLGA